MGEFKICKGRDIKLKGAAVKEIVELPVPRYTAVQPSDFRGLKPHLVVKVDDLVKVGTPILTDKIIPGVKIASSVSGRVAAIERGKKRFLFRIVVESDGLQQKEEFRKFSGQEITHLSREDVVHTLQEGALWPAIRQRPFSHIAHPKDIPKSIFIHAMNTEPLAADIDFILEGKEKEFQIGLDILKKLTQGKIRLCTASGVKSKALTAAEGVETHRFLGPHPAGNVSTHIHHIDPIHKGDIVWYMEAQDVLRIAALFLNGSYPAERIVVATGEGAKRRVYFKTMIGVSLAELLAGSNLQGMRCISGSVLTGQDAGKNGFVRFYDSQVTVIPEGGKREFLGWLSLGFEKYTFSRAFASAFLPEKDFSLDTDQHGSDRAIVLNHIYDQFVPLDIMTYFLLKAVIGGDVEEAEKLGILECDEEDFALCSFACPSKTDVGGIIRQGLDLIEKEG